MKHIVTIIFALACCVLLQQSYASTSVTYEINGLAPGPAYHNVEAVLKNFKKKADAQKTPFDATKATYDTNALIHKALQPYGYFKAEVSTKITLQMEQPYVTITIRPGPEVIVKKVDIVIKGAANKDREFKNLIKQATPKTNKPLNTETYDTLKTLLYNTAAERGYFEASMEKSQITIDKKGLTAAITIHFNSGPRYRFGTITIANNPYKTSFLEKFILIKPGEYYNATELEQSKKNLLNTNNFSNVIVHTTKRNDITDTIDAIVTPQIKKPRQYVIGAGYGTDTGIRGTAGINLRRINSVGHQFSAMLQASQVNNSFTTSYKIPGKDPLTESYAISAGIGHIDQDTGTSDARKIAFSKTVTKGKWRRTTSLNALDENYDITDLPKTDTSMIYPSINWNFRDADDILNPKNGASTSINMAGTSAHLSTQDTGFFQIRTDSDYLKTIKKTNTRLLLRNSIGRTDISNLSQLPLSLQLFAGGSRSIRGYSYNSIGPGRNLFTGTIELQQGIPHTKSWFIAAFYDVGNVADEDIFSDLKESVGPGIVWLSPLGMMELNLAFPISDGNNSLKVQFSMGPAL